jgi:hypothetical protein
LQPLPMASEKDPRLSPDAVSLSKVGAMDLAVPSR